MRAIIDFNSLFSIFRKHSTTRKLVFHPSLELYSPAFALQELAKHRQDVMSKAKISLGEFGVIERILSWQIRFIPAERFRDFLVEAQHISPDPDDAEYFALALKLKAPLWSNDKRLKRQDIIRVYSTSELLKELRLP